MLNPVAEGGDDTLWSELRRRYRSIESSFEFLIEQTPKRARCREKMFGTEHARQIPCRGFDRGSVSAGTDVDGRYSG